jgi:predicted regulator of Ras-like GTPase activity (Roadblock/LC7/MglB family)
MAEKFQEVARVLNDLLGEEDILAATVVARGGGRISPTANLKIRNLAVWNMVGNTMNEAFSIFSKFSAFGIDKLYFELGDYEVVFFAIDSATLLVCVIPALANKGLLEVEIENARRSIRKILKG